MAFFRIQHRRDTEDNWEQENPVLASGEIGLITGMDSLAFKAGNGKTPWKKLPSYCSVPRGGIILWSGTVENIPVGWVLCDGENETPDLRDRFVVGAGKTYASGSQGGSGTHQHIGTISEATPVIDETTLTVQQLARHYHDGAISGGWKAKSAAAAAVNISKINTEGVEEWDEGWQASRTYRVGDSTPHTHSQQPHNHYCDMDSVSTLPPYYALCYIMKL